MGGGGVSMGEGDLWQQLRKAAQRGRPTHLGDSHLEVLLGDVHTPFPQRVHTRLRTARLGPRGQAGRS